MQDGVLYIPSFYSEHEKWSFPGFETIFGRSAPVFVEYCSGHGDWVIQKALAQPDACWIAVEKRFDRVRRIWAKMHNFNVPNLLIVCGEAQVFSRFYLPAQSVDGFFINFPDPWPKNKHAKHRLVQQPFLDDLIRAGKSGAEVAIATDDLPYAQQAVEVFQTPWQSRLPAPHYTTGVESYGSSWFERLWKELGRTIYYLQFVKS